MSVQIRDKELVRAEQVRETLLEMASQSAHRPLSIANDGPPVQPSLSGEREKVLEASMWSRTEGHMNHFFQKLHVLKQTKFMSHLN